MKIKQFEDDALSHYSYAILNENQLVLIDPARNSAPYIDFAKKHQARITGIIETHPHADFVSSHLELHKSTGAIIYCSRFVAADYPHQIFDDGDSLEFGEVKLTALNTPGHSPDSISIVLQYKGEDKAVFTGDTLFIGDCGRPDLRENSGLNSDQREELAHQMYHSLRGKLMSLDDSLLVYPAHGAGTLCGKSLSDASSSTIAEEKANNWCLQEITEDYFVKVLTEEQPHIPKYFAYNVELNKKGAENLSSAISEIKWGATINLLQDAERLDKNLIIIDTRPAAMFKQGHLPNSINIMANGKFETWLGSIIAPKELFYLAAENEEVLEDLFYRAAKIGYESYIAEAFLLKDGPFTSDIPDLNDFKLNQENYTIIDVRNENEWINQKIFSSSINIPLSELRERTQEIPQNKPIIVHCAGGYRSAAGSSILENAVVNVNVYDMGNAIHKFMNHVKEY